MLSLRSRPTRLQTSTTASRETSLCSTLCVVPARLPEGVSLLPLPTPRSSLATPAAEVWLLYLLHLLAQPLSARSSSVWPAPVSAFQPSPKFDSAPARSPDQRQQLTRCDPLSSTVVPRKSLSFGSPRMLPTSSAAANAAGAQCPSLSLPATAALSPRPASMTLLPSSLAHAPEDVRRPTYPRSTTQARPTQTTAGYTLD